MNLRLHKGLCAIAGTTAILFATYALCAEPPGPNAKERTATPKRPNGEERASVSAARERAKQMHDIYAATLEVMHHHYFRNNRSVVPARALEDVFSEIAKQSNVEARWISVNTKAMSIDHEPRNAFEKKASTEIAAGKDAFEHVEKGYYERAGAIPLASGCVGCHTGFFATPPKSPRFAGLVIRVPLNDGH